MGILVVLDLTIADYNRAILSESMFVSLHVLCLALLIWHYDRKERLRWWEMVLAGILFGWTFLIRGAGVALVIPVILVYAWMTRSWRQPAMVAAGFALLTLSVMSLNLWSYGEFGLVGPQHSTLASALFSYHHFSPDNGPASAQIDAQLRDCQPDIDYDDVPRYRNSFIFAPFEPCMHSRWSPIEVTGLTSDAYREMLTSRFYEVSLRMLEEVGLFLAQPVTNGSDIYSYGDYYASSCSGYFWCDEIYSGTGTELRDQENVIKALTRYPRQIYLGMMYIVHNNYLAVLAGWVMITGFVVVFTDTRSRFMMLVCAGFIFYHLSSTVAAHAFLIRYAEPLTPFFSLMSVITLSVLLRGIVRTIRK